MIKVVFTTSLLFFACLSYAQQKQGKVTYERIAQVRINIAGANNSDQPQTRIDKFELTFGNNQSLYKQVEKENEDENMSGDGMQVKVMVAGADDILYNNFSDAKRSELRVMFDKKFIVDDSIRPLKWKIGEETKNILNHVCFKATATTVNPRMTMNIDNGIMQRKEIQDTVNITAWFTNEIPVPAGPAEYQGQLPGLILALDVNNGRMVYKAVDITDKADMAVIKAPLGKKHYTPAEYRKERDKLFEDMQQNGMNGNRQIRIN